MKNPIVPLTYFRRIAKIKGKSVHSGRGFYECTSDKGDGTYNHIKPIVEKLVSEGKAVILGDNQTTFWFELTEEKLETCYRKFQVFKYSDRMNCSFLVFY